MHPQQFTDQTNYTITLSGPPNRIISLVPSQTELLADLGLGDRVVGITKFCIHPDTWRKSKAIVGGTKSFDLELIASLQPDLVLGNKEENYESGINLLRSHYPVWISDIVTLKDATDMIRDIGVMTQTESRADWIGRKIHQAFRDLDAGQSKSVLYLIWKNPWMAAGQETFINAMVEKMGWINAVQADRYPELTDEQIKALNPDIVLLSSEPFPFRDKHIAELKHLAPRSRIMTVDGEMFSWYGSRLLKSPAYFTQLKARLGC